jgi:crossover junction endodeoxyribonuclease RuvC
MITNGVRILGLDPGLGRTGWGLVASDGSRLSHIANGSISSDASLELAPRLVQLFERLSDVVDRLEPQEAGVEETFVNRNPASTLKLGQARGVVMLVPALRGIPIGEYAPNQIKKSVVGTGHAAKEQIRAMVRVLLPGVKIENADAADALAVAICHAHHAFSGQARALAAGRLGERAR